MSDIELIESEEQTFGPPDALAARAAVRGMQGYEALVAEAGRDYAAFWARLARETLAWKKPFTTILDESNAPFYKWFLDGRLNASYNCLDRQLLPHLWKPQLQQ